MRSLQRTMPASVGSCAAASGAPIFALDTHMQPLLRCPSLALALLLAGCGAASAARHLDPQLLWVDDNRARIDAFLDEMAGSPQARRVAIFDWDNTVIKNDVGDITTFWMLRHDKVLQPEGGDWRTTNKYLTSAAADALAAACGALASPGSALPTSKPEGVACVDEILAVYTEGATTAGDDAFAGWNHRTMEPAYAWTVQLQAGHRPADIQGFAEAAITEALAAEIGAEQTLGTTKLNAYVRIYDQMRDLIATLQADGFEVWVLSASSQPVVEAFAARVDVPADRVVGVRAVIGDDGVLTRNLQGCGAVADGTDELIPYIEGKRCWMNKIIFGVDGPAAAAVQTNTADRPVFCAGDSDTDTSFLQDATGLKLVLNRNKKELMCNAYHDVGGNWLVNPMFIAPKAELADGYACSVDACVDAAGVGGPCRDERGGAIADQKDRTFCDDGVYCQR